MKTLLIILLSSVLIQPILKAQTYDSIDVNDINALIGSHGNNFWDGESDAHFYVPKPTLPGQIPVSSIFAQGLWIGGIDDGGNLHIAAQTYRQSGGDFWPGPVATDYDAPGYTDTYDNVWVVDKSTIDNHILNWATAGYIVPASIANWPGNGNIANGEAAILAPFYDYNNNAIYDPENGDYPKIRGDEAAFFMMNDDANDHTESMGDKLKLEIHGTAYAFDMPGDSALRKTIFINYQIINRSAENYHDFYLGLFTDFDLGFYNDDFLGCDSNLNLFYAYNGDLSDGPSAFSYGFNAPAQGVAFLNQRLNSFKYFNNDFTVTGNPAYPENFYGYMKGLWGDGSSQTFGGNGYGGIQPANYLYSSSPLDPDGWSEFTELNTPSDRRGLGSSGPFNLNSGDSLCFEIALITAFSYDTLVTDSVYGNFLNRKAVDVLTERIPSVQDFYYSNFEDCSIVYERNADYVELIHTVPEADISIYPNPVMQTIHITTEQENKFFNTSIEIINAIGETVKIVRGLDGANANINVSDLPKGIYQLKFISQTGASMNASFVKQ